MKVLGIHVGHDSSVCLLEDGRVRYAMTEERLCRIKHKAGFPLQSVLEVLKLVKADEIDFVAMSGVGLWKEFMKKVKKEYWKKCWFYKRPFLLYPPIFKLFEHKMLKTLGITAPIKFVEHHTAHHFSAIAQSGYKKCMSISIDGWGDFKSYMANVWEDGKITPVAESDQYDSVGCFYTMATLLAGFKPNEGEGKTMGLAPYGKHTALPLFQKIISYKNLKFKTPKRWYKFDPSKDPAHMEVLKNSKILRLTKEFSKEDIAASAQQHLEDMMLNLTDDLVDGYGIKQFALSGGVALNCVTNGLMLKKIKDIFIQPHAGDGGIALGAAYKVHFDETGSLPSEQVQDVYYGNEFSDDEIKIDLKKYKLKYEKLDVPWVAEELSKGKIVGWFQGRDEWGPRALGNRSILGDPRKEENKEILNSKIKHREPFRPFCPSLLEEAGKTYLKNYYECPFMTINFEVNKPEDMVAASHIDHTARPQTVTKKQNKKYYEIIQEFGKITKVPILINTSFNVMGEPMVHRPKEAINDFLKTKMDYLVLGNYLVKK